MTLTEKQWRTVYEALRVAADVYAQDARISKNGGVPRLAAAFEQQRAAAAELLELIEQVVAL